MNCHRDDVRERGFLRLSIQEWLATKPLEDARTFIDWLDEQTIGVLSYEYTSEASLYQMAIYLGMTQHMDVDACEMAWARFEVLPL